MPSRTHWGLQACPCMTARLATQLAIAPGLRDPRASASMYAVAKVSPAPFVSTAATCGQKCIASHVAEEARYF